MSTEVVGASEEKSEMKFHSGSGPVMSRFDQHERMPAEQEERECRE